MITERAAGLRALVDDVRHMHPLDRRALAGTLGRISIGAILLVIALVAVAHAIA